MSTRAGPLRRSGLPEDHGQRANVVAPRRFGLCSRTDRPDEIGENAEMPADAILRREWRRISRFQPIEQAAAVARLDNLDPNLIGAVPGQRPLRANEAPGALPRGSEPRSAPRAAIDEHRAILELEDRRCGRTVAIP